MENYGEPIQGSRLRRAFCSFCRLPMRVQESEINNEQEHYCRDCKAPPAARTGLTPRQRRHLKKEFMMATDDEFEKWENSVRDPNVLYKNFHSYGAAAFAAGRQCERERCAKIAEGEKMIKSELAYNDACEDIAAAIRAAKEESND